MSFTMQQTSKDSNALEEHQRMYLFVYKTTHVNGKFYIGRHQTNNLSDGYLGSGKWVSGIKDKSSLSKEIIAEANSVEELCKLEEYYIDLHWNDPLCMNMKKASIGWTSEDAMKTVEKGNNPFLTRPDGTNLQIDRVNAGTHNLLKRQDGSSLTQDRVKKGTHHFLTRPDGTNLQIDRVNAGTHNFQTRTDGSSLQQDRVKGGTHHFQTRTDGTNINTDRVNAGTHHFLQLNNGNVACYNKSGEYKRIPKEQYHSQSGPKEDWEWVTARSFEGKRRKLPKEN